MNKIFAFFPLILLASILTAQEPSNPAAKSYYKSLKKTLEKLASMQENINSPLYERDLNSAGEKVGFIEKYEPGFNFDKERNEYLKFRKQFDDAKNEGITKSNDSYELKKELEEIFKSPYGHSLGKEDPKGFYESFIAKSEKYKSENAKEKFKEAPGSLKDEARGFDVVTKDIESSINDAGSIEQATVYYYRTKVYVEYWNLALYFEPNNTVYSENLKAIKVTEAKIGSLENIKSNIIKKAKERADKKQLPTAVRKDSELESKIKQSFLSVAKKMGENFEITKINIITNDWLIIRNQYTGAIVRRSQSAAVAVKKEGKCYVYDFVNYYQQYDGSKYIGGECGTDYDWAEEINCTNLSK